MDTRGLDPGSYPAYVDVILKGRLNTWRRSAKPEIPNVDETPRPHPLPIPYDKRGRLQLFSLSRALASVNRGHRTL
jgi:hypothetical protein